MGTKDAGERRISSIKWQQNVRPAKHSSVVQGLLLPLMNGVCSQVEDAGLYTCLASSVAGEDGKSHWVRVQGDTGSFCPSGTECPPPHNFLSGASDLMNDTLSKLKSEDLRFHSSEGRLGLASGVHTQRLDCAKTNVLGGTDVCIFRDAFLSCSNKI